MIIKVLVGEVLYRVLLYGSRALDCISRFNHVAFRYKQSIRHSSETFSDSLFGGRNAYHRTISAPPP